MQYFLLGTVIGIVVSLAMEFTQKPYKSYRNNKMIVFR